MSNNSMWVALAIFGGIYAYSTLKSDGKALIDSAKDAVNITSDKNLAYKATNAVFGEDFVIDKIGGGIAKLLGTDPLAQTKNAPSTSTSTTQSGAIPYVYLDAKQLNGKWYKLVSGKWLLINSVDKIVMQNGRYKAQVIKAKTATKTNTVGVLKPAPNQAALDKAATNSFWDSFK